MPLDHAARSGYRTNLRLPTGEFIEILDREES
jgi:hypothetical protein